MSGFPRSWRKRSLRKSRKPLQKRIGAFCRGPSSAESPFFIVVVSPSAVVNFGAGRFRVSSRIPRAVLPAAFLRHLPSPVRGACFVNRIFSYYSWGSLRGDGFFPCQGEPDVRNCEKALRAPDIQERRHLPNCSRHLFCSTAPRASVGRRCVLPLVVPFGWMSRGCGSAALRFGPPGA